MNIIINNVTFTFTYIDRIFHKYNYNIIIKNKTKEIDSDKLNEFIKYSMMLGVNIQHNRIDIISKIDKYFEAKKDGNYSEVHLCCCLASLSQRQGCIEIVVYT